MTKFKLVVLTIVAIIVLIVVLQNTASVETKLLFVTVTMPRAILLFGTFLIGFVLGLLVASRIARKPGKKKDA